MHNAFYPLLDAVVRLKDVLCRGLKEVFTGVRKAR
jgi:hypothetical protein